MEYICFELFSLKYKMLEFGEFHDDVIKWKYFPRYWPFVRGIHRSPVNSPHRGQWRGALMFSWIFAWINGWVNNRKGGDLRRHCVHYDVIVMFSLPVMNTCVWGEYQQCFNTYAYILMLCLLQRSNCTYCSKYVLSFSWFCMHRFDGTDFLISGSIIFMVISWLFHTTQFTSF